MKKSIITYTLLAVLIITIAISLILFNKKNKEYEVVFMSDESVYTKQVVKRGDLVKKPKDPKKDGYFFVEWTLNDSAYAFNTKIEKNLTLTAKWEKKDELLEKIVVKFETDSQSVYPNQIINKGGVAKKPEDPEKDGYIFTGWVVNDIEFDFSTELFEDTTIKATWEQKESVNEDNKKVTKDNSSTSKTNTKTINVATPTLSIPAGTPGEFHLSIGVEGNYAKGHSSIKGWELYEKVNGSYKKYGSYTSFKSVSVTLEPGQTRIFKARVYALDSKGNKVYSKYSNKISQSRKVLKPTLSTPAGGPGFFHLSVLIEGNYASDHSEIAGWELYEKVNGSYTKYGTYTNFNSVVINLEPGQTRTFKARAYALDSKGNKVYSDYSNEETNKYEVLQPTLTTPAGGPGFYQLSIIMEGNYVNNHEFIDGWEIYEKINGSYTKYGEYTGFNAVVITLESDQTRTFKARAYALDSKGNKVYSDYSNEITQ